MESAQRSKQYKFKAFILDVERGTLTRDGQEVPLRPKAFAVLHHLVANEGKLVSRDELIEAAWGHLHVTDSSLSQCLREIRNALDDHEQELISTVPRRGYRFDLPSAIPDSAASSAEGTTSTRTGSRRIFITLAAVAVAALGYLALRGVIDDEESPGLATAYSSPISIAVLPLLDLSPGGDLGYLADGLAEEILNNLAQSDDLRVIARTSSFSFRGEHTDLDRIARELDVDLVLQGSVRRSGETVRVTAQLIDTSTNAHLWSRSYDHALADLFLLQSEVAMDVSNVLNAKVNPPSGADAVGPGAEAYEAYLVGVHFLNRGDVDSLERACESLKQATEFAPEFAAAWSKHSDCTRRLALRSPESSAELFPAYLESAERALALNPELPEALYLRAMMLRFKGQDAEFQEAIAQGLESGSNDPNFLMLAMGDAEDYGQLDAAVALGERALRLDPLSAIVRNNFAAVLIDSHRYREALAQYEELLALYPGSGDWQSGYVNALILAERYEQAAEAAREIPDRALRNQALAFVYWGQGEQPKARALIGSNQWQDELGRLMSLVQWFAYTGQHQEAFATLKMFRNEYDIECFGPNSQGCARLSVFWSSPFLDPVRETPEARAWLETYFPGHARRTQQRVELYKSR